MALITIDLNLTLDHDPADELQLHVGSSDGLTLAESTPAGGTRIAQEPIGPLADEDPAAVRTLSATHRPPGGCAVLALGVSVKDQAGNVSPLFETFAEIADHPRGVATLPVQATGSDNEALFTWTESPDFEGAST